MKKVIFKNKPEANSFGQYNFSDDEVTPYTHTDSNSVPIRYDKFSDKDLYTTTVDNNLNKDIIDGELQYNKNSYIHIDKLTIKNGGVNHAINNIGTWAYIFDNKLSGDITEDSTYSEVHDAIKDSQANIYGYRSPEKGEGKHLGNIIEGATILSNLYNDDGPVYPANWQHAPQWPENSAISASKTYFSDMFDSNGVFNETESSGIFNFDTTQTIYVIVFTSGDEVINWWPDNERRNRIHVFRINTETDLIDPEDGGGVSQLPFEYGDALIFEGGGDKKPAWKVTDLQLTINTTPETLTNNEEGGYFPDEQYHPITGSVTPPVKVELGKNFNSQILRINPSAQILSANAYNYTPVSKTNILGSQYDLQNYYTSDEERQVASAPTQVSLDFEISTDIESDETELTSTTPTLGHMFYVVSWDDMDDKFKTWDDVLDDIPENEVRLLEKQQDNLYIFNDISTPLINNYQVAGIKTIKSVMFSYDTTTTDNTTVIEPVRWKLITTRIFLDIPVNQYPDFGEVGGVDYTTIPWPHTTPVIGGTDEDSKYKISVQDTLSGGKIGNADIIDQTFLINANENDELGQSIRKFDLEQVRYFNSSYDMTSLLGISITTDGTDFTPHNHINLDGTIHWDGETNSFSEETSVGEIFISDNSDATLKQDCKLELNCGNLTGKSIVDSSGNSNKGLLIGDYKIKKTRKNRPMRRDSFIKIPKKNSNSNGAL